MDEPILAWYFAGTDRRMRHGGVLLRVGENHSFVGELVMGERGFHGCCDPLDALIHGQGSIACRVRLGGERKLGPKRVCTREMEVLSMSDAETMLRDSARRAIRDALPANISTKVDRDTLRALRSEVESRTEALHDGQWAIEQGKNVDIDGLTRDLEMARRNAALVDAALRLDESTFERLRSAIEDLLDCGVVLELQLDTLPPLADFDPAQHHEPEQRNRGLAANAEMLGRALGQLRWVRAASFAKRREDLMPILFIDTGRRARDRSTAARRVCEALRAVPTLPVMLLIFDRTHTFELDLAREHRLLGDGLHEVKATTRHRDHSPPRDIPLVRPKPIVVDVSPQTVLRPARPEKDPTWVLDPYLKKEPKKEPTAPRIPTNHGVRVQSSRPLRQSPPTETITMWGPHTFSELALQLESFRLKPGLLLDGQGVEPLLVSAPRTEADALVVGEQVRRLPPHLHADIFVPTNLTRVALMGALGPRRRVRLQPLVATSLGVVSRFRVWSDALPVSGLRAAALGKLPWLYGVWEAEADTPVFEVLRRSTRADPHEHAIELRRALGRDRITIGFIGSNEWLSVWGRSTYLVPAVRIPRRRRRTLMCVLDPDAD